MSSGDSGRLVALDLPAGPAFLRALERIWDRGDAVLPLPQGMPAGPRADLMARVQPGALVDGSGETRLDGGAPVARGTALVVVTSGSTGTPKGVVLSHTALTHAARASLARLDASTQDRWLCCLPLDHVAGLQILVRSRVLGVPPVIHPRFDPDAVADERGVTMISLVPTMLQRLMDAEVDLRRFRTILLGGAAAPPQLIERASEIGARVVTTYGMTETGGGCVYDGVPLDGVEVSVADSGRLRIRGPVLLDGYRGEDVAPIEDGWFTTSDLGRWEAGRLVVEGRADGVIITGGENVVPEHVEAVLLAHPAVREVAVVGRPDPRWGQRVVAVVVSGAGAPTLAELREHAASALPRHCLPHELDVRAALPLLGNGKVDRARLSSAGGETG